MPGDQGMTPRGEMAHIMVTTSHHHRVTGETGHQTINLSPPDKDYINIKSKSEFLFFQETCVQRPICVKTEEWLIMLCLCCKLVISIDEIDGLNENCMTCVTIHYDEIR